MSKRTLAALLALLVAASTLAVVASPVGAHSQTKQQCAYDPFAGNQCWTVNVSHTHSCPSGMTGTPPNCYPAPSTNQQNTGDEEAKKAAEEARKAAEEAKRKAEEEAKRKADEEAKRKAEEEAKRKADEEARRQRRAAEEEAKRRAEQEAKRKAAEEAERKRKEAEEAEKKRKKAEEEAKKCPPRQTGTPPDCRTDLRLCGTPQSTAHAKECEAERKRQKAEKDAEKKKALEEATKPEPCGGSGGEGATAHHKHGGPCHADTPGHTHDFTAKCPGSYKYNADTELCELTGAVKITQDIGKVVVEVEGQIVCTFTAGGVASKVVNTVLKHVSEAAKFVTKNAIQPYIKHPCDQVWEDITDWVESNAYKPDTTDPNDSDDDEADDGDNADDDDGITTADDVNKAAEQQAAGKITAAEYNRIKNAYFCTTVKLESYCPGGVHNPASQADASSDDSDPPDDDDVKEAEAKWRRGEIDGDELTRIQNERDCAKGYAWAQNCP